MSLHACDVVGILFGVSYISLETEVKYNSYEENKH